MQTTPHVPHTGHASSPEWDACGVGTSLFHLRLNLAFIFLNMLESFLSVHASACFACTLSPAGSPELTHDGFSFSMAGSVAGLVCMQTCVSDFTYNHLFIKLGTLGARTHLLCRGRQQAVPAAPLPPRPSWGLLRSSFTDPA